VLVVVLAVAGVLVNSTVLVPRRSREQVRQGTRAIWRGLDAYARAHGGHYPPATLVRPRKPGSSNAHERRTVGAYLPSWPLNPFSDRPMHAGTGPGDFSYVRGPGGHRATLTGFGVGGKTVITLPAGR
jgi:hypothetical protein